MAGVTVLYPDGLPPRTEVLLNEVELERRSGEGNSQPIQSITLFIPGANGGDGGTAMGVDVLSPGERWRFDLVAARVGWTPRGLGQGMERLSSPTLHPYTLSGLRYSDDLLPRSFLLHLGGSTDLGEVSTEEAVAFSFSQWNGVGCSGFQFVYDGLTDLEVAQDGQNVLVWEEETWEWDPEVAGVTLHYYGYDEDSGEVYVNEADVFFNAVDWTWTREPGDAYLSPPEVNVESVLTHELGHVTGLGHVTDDPTTTMFYAYVGGDWLATLSGDDRAGICANYPISKGECEEDEDCAAVDGTPRVCLDVEGFSVCEEVRDALGDSCSRTYINCDGYCVFTNLTATEGYCTTACMEEEDCPEGWSCQEEDRKLPTDESLVCQPDPTSSDDDSTPTDDDASSDDDDSSGEEDPPPDGGCSCAQGEGKEEIRWGGAGAFLILWGRRRRSSFPASPTS